MGADGGRWSRKRTLVSQAPLKTFSKSAPTRRDWAGMYLARRRAVGRRLEDVRDAMIAGIALSLAERGNRVALATRNGADFAFVEDLGDVRLINPWRADAPAG